MPAKTIVAVTFTNKAAREMRERVNRLLSKGSGKGLLVSTFHTLGMRIFRREAERDWDTKAIFPFLTARTACI